jgi:hypothetical protein
LKIYDVMFLDIGAAVEKEEDFKETPPEIVARASVTADAPEAAAQKAAVLMRHGLNPARRYRPAVIEIMDLEPKQVVTATPEQLAAALRSKGLSIPGR